MGCTPLTWYPRLCTGMQRKITTLICMLISTHLFYFYLLYFIVHINVRIMVHVYNLKIIVCILEDIPKIWTEKNIQPKHFQNHCFPQIKHPWFKLFNSLQNPSLPHGFPVSSNGEIQTLFRWYKRTLTRHEVDSLLSENYKMRQKARNFYRIKNKEQGRDK